MTLQAEPHGTVSGRFEHHRTATEGGEVHDARRTEGESLVRGDERVSGGGADGANRGVVPVHDVADDPRPVTSGSARGSSDGASGLGDEANDALGYWVEVVVVRRAGGVVYAGVSPEVEEELGH